MMYISVPAGHFAVDEDAAAAKRREIAERLKIGKTLKAPEGKLA